MNSAYSVAIGSRSGEVPENLWLNNRTWDLTFISFSAILVVLPFGAYEILKYLLTIDSFRESLGVNPADVLDVSRNIVNGLIALFIGGPHMYSTYTRTFLDGEFRKHHVFFLLGSLVLPFIVVYLGIVNFQLLITFFFFWASIHILHQIAYIIDCYNQKNSRPISLPSRILDYAVVFSSLYPIGVWRMVNNDFKIGQISLLFPDFLLIQNNPTTGWAVFLLAVMIFGVSVTLWLGRTYREYVRGELHTPKALLMGLTIVVSFFIPAYHELDVAFQGFNTWHSFQYLGLTLYINRLRQQKEGISTPLIRSLSAEGRGWRFYMFNVGCAVVAVGMIGLLLLNRHALGFTFDQCYYVVVLSFLLMHYYHDHLLFTKTDAILA
ncbi:MAG TPA: hypothetical protein VGR15_10580 [Bacteroidota bacterium]|jgi:hypothetical protein|nr:hypothetical protein [Bacteroidota bacterium]